MTKKPVGQLVNWKVPAIGFVNEGKLNNNGDFLTEKENILREWLKQGLELGNHTFSHPDYNDLSFAEYKENTIRGEKNLKPLLASYNKQLKFFRHPYLHRGNTKEKVDSLQQYLVSAGYTEAPVTVDNSDYIFAKAYDTLLVLDDSVTIRNLVKDYIDYMGNKIDFYESQSRQLFGRNLNQILLLHANALNANHISDLLQMLTGKGYSFISLDEALTDEAYKSKDSFYKRGGISWIHRWAITQGKTKEFFTGEPLTPQYIMTLSGFTNE